MDFKLMATTFVAVFLAELGDKTQLATLTFATSGQSRWAVFLGSAAALVATSAIAVLAGEAITRVISPALLKRLAGVAFVVIGAWVLWSSRSSA
ncbi:MAG: TMEM165/GDT1 family protein [Myxococcaceae bacterium]|nr:TMEM165/GDT1 family protein [Myxococcaceae bacterium]